MKTNSLLWIDKLIRWSFYAIFFLVPLVMYPSTFELFEFNKMWTVFGFSLIILLLWASKMFITKKFYIRRTPLDILLLLFLASQVISWLFSMDQYVSFWGYYSRFNGGVLSTMTYIFLYYAYVSNVIEDTKQKVIPSVRMLGIFLISGLLVALWGFSSHFGADLTCLAFGRGLNVSCWSDAFKPTIRMFSTMGQPDWLAALFAILIPISFAFMLGHIATRTLKQQTKKNPKGFLSILLSGKTIFYFLVALLLWVELIWTSSKSGFLGLMIGLFFFWAFIWIEEMGKHKRAFLAAYFILNSLLLTLSSYKSTFAIFAILGVTVYIVLYALVHRVLLKEFLLVNLSILLIAFFIGTPLYQLNNFTFKGVQTALMQQPIPHQSAAAKTSPTDAPSSGELGGTDSGKIRSFVWRGAVDIFTHYPLFGTGPETFAYAYYQYRPAGHNLTSEWDFLYNKAHNEYLNYLATTGILGIGTYLALIGYFFFTAGKFLYKEFEDPSEKRLDPKWTRRMILLLGILAGYVTMLVTNFFGFSVVITNLFLFISPLFFYDIADHAFLGEPQKVSPYASVNAMNATAITILALIVLSFEFVLLRYWLADQHYALGNNLDKAGEYLQAYPELTQAVQMRPGEDLFKDELSVNMATLALALDQQNEATQASQLAKQARALSDQVITDHPKNVVYWKSRTRVMYSFAKIDPQYMDDTLQAIEKAHQLAPTDAKIEYNLGLLYDQAGESDKAIAALEKTVQLKSNYRDARFSLALILVNQAKTLTKQGNNQKSQQYKDEAKQQLEYILKYIAPDDKQAQELLKTL